MICGLSTCYEARLQNEYTRRDPRCPSRKLGGIRQRAGRGFSPSKPPLRSVSPARGRRQAENGVAIGDRVLDLAGMRSEGLLDSHHGAEGLRSAADACASGSLNALMALPSGPRHALRRRIHAILRGMRPRPIARPLSRHLVAQSDVNLVLPAVVGDYADFYASIFHAGNVGKLFRPDNPLLPNYKYIPIGYHGRASSLVPSGTPIRRPCGQTRNGDAAPQFGPTRSLDYELELGFFVSGGNSLGETIPIARAEEDIFGICLVNDWSARDMQAWEYQPLGPFLAKSFATSLSPWVVTIEALAPFRTPAFVRAEADPPPLPYLFDQADQDRGGLDLWLEVSLCSVRMREAGVAAVVLGRSNFRDMYWTMAQMLTHHASNGCNLRPGDLLASGTVSGADPAARGCLLELTGAARIRSRCPMARSESFWKTATKSSSAASASARASAA